MSFVMHAKNMLICVWQSVVESTLMGNDFQALPFQIRLIKARLQIIALCVREGFSELILDWINRVVGEFVNLRNIMIRCDNGIFSSVGFEFDF